MVAATGIEGGIEYLLPRDEQETYTGIKSEMHLFWTRTSTIACYHVNMVTGTSLCEMH
jgi:hypothetical protein